MAQQLIKRKNRTKAQFDPAHGLSAFLKAVESTVAIKHTLDFKAGDTVKVYVRIKEGEKERVQLYEGTVIRMGNHTTGRSITVRKISHGVGVERVFLMNSPIIERIEMAQRGRVRRAKLYYLRGLVGRAARVENLVKTQESVLASEAAKAKKMK